MTKINKILIGVIVFLLIMVAFLYKKTLDNKKILLLEEKENKEIIRLVEELKSKEELGIINKLYQENNIYYFQIDEDMEFILNSDVFQREKIDKDGLFNGYRYMNNQQEIKFEYRYEYIYYPKLAILIDDVGMNTKVAENFVELGMKLNYAVLPFLPRSLEAGEILRKAGHTTILHMPMEGSNENLNKKTEGLLHSKMPAQEIKKTFDKAMDNVGNLKGFNNHMGSVFTSNEEKIKTLLDYIKDKDLYFIDSNTSRNTKAHEIAKKIGIPTFKCSGFLDNSNKVEDIEKEIVRFINMAKDREKVLVIGHYHQNMVEALKNKKEFIEKSGVKLVYIEEIL